VSIEADDPLSLSEGGAVTLLLNLDARSVLAKGWRYPVKDMRNYPLVVQFDDRTERTPETITME
jgi:hypothetical protein